MSSQSPLAPGALLARGVARHLRSLDFMSVPEVTLPGRLRVDLMALGPKGEIWVVECKSSRADFMADGKWQGYLEWADRFFWAVDADFPIDLLPDNSGLIMADGYGAEILRMPDATPLAAARRKSVTLRFARVAAARHQGMCDAGITWGA
ncbi:MmcB family DNA repair protein [Meridianimarinicoccus aquatilis]|uniref:DNA repair protein MmcB-related protein n=1 Tax=Meridianimarinicoccus aquatilis TaxID=2552766 RepID=A0A4V3BCG9_9RHOB|nr:MmcB family DNA repair protein [Fluviibacterium aquatile]TDL90919.1 DNA repair protein MmcB-related protein [Fluviibacterium aquatile]